MIYYVTSDSLDAHALLLEAFDDDIATAAILSISNGSLGLLREDGGFVMPAGMSKTGVATWLATYTNTPNPDAIINRVDRTKLADALDSFFLGNRDEYRAKTREWAGHKPDIRSRLRKAWDESRNGGEVISVAQLAWNISGRLRIAVLEPTPPAQEADHQPSS